MTQSAMRAAFALLVSGCCSSAVHDRAVERAHVLEASVVEDRNPDGPPAAACSDVPLVTLDEVKARAHEGELVAFDGEPVRDGTMHCEQALCVDDCDRPLPCCNDCQGGYRLVVPATARASLRLVGKGMSCGGNQCAVQCTPFGTHPRRGYRFVGRFTVVPSTVGFFEAKLDVERWCHAAD